MLPVVLVLVQLLSSQFSEELQRPRGLASQTLGEARGSSSELLVVVAHQTPHQQHDAGLAGRQAQVSVAAPVSPPALRRLRRFGNQELLQWWRRAAGRNRSRSHGHQENPSSGTEPRRCLRRPCPCGRRTRLHLHHRPPCGRRGPADVAVGVVEDRPQAASPQLILLLEAMVVVAQSTIELAQQVVVEVGHERLMLAVHQQNWLLTAEAAGGTATPLEEVEAAPALGSSLVAVGQEGAEGASQDASEVPLKLQNHHGGTCEYRDRDTHTCLQ